MSSDDFVEDPSGAASGYVQATADCAHLDKVVTTDSFSPDLFTAKCHDCDNVVENWVCLNCYQTFCGRFAKRHMVKHNEATGHCIVVSLADLSCWCYECDQYLDHLSIRPIFETYRALHVIKFNKQSVQKFQGAASEDEKSQKQKDQRDAETMKTILAQQRQQQRPQSGAVQASSSSPTLPAVEEEASEDEAEEPEENEDGGGQKFVEMMAKLMKAEAGDETPDEEKATEGPLKAADLASFAEAIKSGAIKKVVVMAGAGISVSAGIPDFRSPKTGLYANLAKYNLPHPEAVFEIDYFRTNPKPFCTLAKELYPGSFNPTPAHFFIKLLADKGLLVRCYTQNIDGLEFHAGLSSDQVIQAHGGFQTAHCLSCGELYPEKYCKDFIFRDEVPTCAKCEGLVKPDIVFFGESLPARFHQSVPVDFSGADALIVMGTSLKVQPFASLVDRVPSSAARLLINLEKVGTAGNMGFLERLLMGTRGFDFDSPSNKRDVFIQDSTDSGVRVLADALGWRAELDKLIADGSKLTDSKL